VKITLLLDRQLAVFSPIEHLARTLRPPMRPEKMKYRPMRESRYVNRQIDSRTPCSLRSPVDPSSGREWGDHSRTALRPMTPRACRPRVASLGVEREVGRREDGRRNTRQKS